MMIASQLIRRCFSARLRSLRPATITQHRLQTSGTFVSEHYRLRKEEMRDLVQSLGSASKEVGDDVYMKVCCLCDKDNKEKPDNLWKLRIRPNGSYYCHRCSTGGSYFDLKKEISGRDMGLDTFSTSSALGRKPMKSSGGTGSIYAKEVESKGTDDYDTPPSSTDTAAATKTKLAGSSDNSIDLETATQSLYDQKYLEGSKEAKQAAQVLHYLREKRGLNDDIIKLYGIAMINQSFISENGKFENKLCVAFPWIYPDSEGDFKTVRLKIRALETKGMQRMMPKGGPWGFFGWQHVDEDEDKEIIITEGEYDAMAVAQALSTLPATHPLRHIPVISLPNGCNSLPVDLIPQLEKFTKIYLWMDNDKSGMEGSEKFAKKLGIRRVFLVKPDSSMKNAPKDANDALRMKDEFPDLIPQMILTAEKMSHEKLQKFPAYRSEVLSLIRRKDRMVGTPTKSLTELTKIVKGFRPGELVIFTGPTGAGKTTCLSQMSLDFAKEGVPTLWGSFEIINAKLIEKMLRQSYRPGALELISHEKQEQVADNFAALPLTFMNFHGASDISQILDAMEHAVYNDDVRHIIIDNLQFMMPSRESGGRGSYDKFSAQDMVISKLRLFATEKRVNVILVVHPRKEEESAHLDIASVFGTAKATQEADIVLILQGRRGGLSSITSLDVRKNRYDGTLGSIALKYSSPLHSFVTPSDAELVLEDARLEEERASKPQWGRGRPPAAARLLKATPPAAPAAIVRSSNDSKTSSDDGISGTDAEGSSSSTEKKKVGRKKKSSAAAEADSVADTDTDPWRIPEEEETTIVVSSEQNQGGSDAEKESKEKNKKAKMTIVVDSEQKQGDGDAEKESKDNKKAKMIETIKVMRKQGQSLKAVVKALGISDYELTKLRKETPGGL